jgi:ribosomal protein L37AE/L43A
MTQRYTSETARARMAVNTCPECGQAPERHLTSNAFWLPRHCDLTQDGVADRIAAFLDPVPNPT